MKFLTPLLELPTGGLLLVVILIAFFLYFIPTMLAKGPSAIGVFLLNLFLGWTLLGWIGALVWAISSSSNSKSAKRHKELIKTLEEKQENNNVYSQQNFKNITRDNNESVQISYGEKSDLLAQLSQLHNLKINNVITEEIYEEERQSILSKFQKPESQKVEIGKDEVEPADSIQQVYDPNYIKLFENKSWAKKNKAVIIIFISVCISCLIIYFANSGNVKIADAKIINTKIKDLQDLSDRLFQQYKSKLEIGNVAVGIDTSYVGDINGDGFLDVVKYYDLEPTDGGNYIAEQGLLFYKNVSDSLIFIKKYIPHYLFSFDTINNSKIYITKQEYAENDGRCCPSIHTKIVLTLDKNKIKEKVVKP